MVQLPSAVGLAGIGAVDLPEMPAGVLIELRHGGQLLPGPVRQTAAAEGLDVHAVQEGPDQVVMPAGGIVGEESGEGRPDGDQAPVRPGQPLQQRLLLLPGADVEEHREGLAGSLLGLIQMAVGIEDVAVSAQRLIPEGAVDRSLQLLTALLGLSGGLRITEMGCHAAIDPVRLRIEAVGAQAHDALHRLMGGGEGIVKARGMQVQRVAGDAVIEEGAAPEETELLHEPGSPELPEGPAHDAVGLLQEFLIGGGEPITPGAYGPDDLVPGLDIGLDHRPALLIGGAHSEEGVPGHLGMEQAQAVPGIDRCVPGPGGLVVTAGPEHMGMAQEPRGAVDGPVTGDDIDIQDILHRRFEAAGDIRFLGLQNRSHKRSLLYIRREDHTTAFPELQRLSYCFSHIGWL